MSYFDPDEYYDPHEAATQAVLEQLAGLQQKVDGFNQRLIEEQAAAEDAEAFEHLAEAVAERLDTLNVPEHLRDIIVSRACSMEPGDDGLPDIGGAVDEMRTAFAAEHQPPHSREFPEEGTESEKRAWQVERAEELSRWNEQRAEMIAAYHPANSGPDYDNLTDLQATRAQAEQLGGEAA